MNNPLNGIVGWQLETGQLDHWTSYHIAAGLFIAKVAQWLGASDLWAVLWVVIIGIAWEILEWVVEGWKPYGSKRVWLNNTLSDLIVEIGLAAWMVI